MVGISGNQSSLDITFKGSIEDGDLTVFVRGTESVTFNTFRFRICRYNMSALLQNKLYDASVAEITEVIEFYPTKNVPEIKVIDFLTGSV